jgi:ParB family chromosome partitioning protein
MEVDQGKIAAMIETGISKKGTPVPLPSNREIKKLFVGKEQAGSITRDSGSFTVKIKATALDPVKEQAIREFVEGLFKD